MIKSVSIQNFESHEDTTIHFENGMNLIVGLSNSGKSAIIRALACVVDNRWEKSMVRTGYEFCRVKIETDRGWVECERGEKVNRWRCKEGNNDVQEYKSVGTGVPDLATKILGMGERDRGADIKELPNFQFQLEKHYMLSEIDGKKATSNMIARMMDNAIGLGGMEDLIKAISTDLLKDRKWLSEKQQEINTLKNDILDDALFNKKEKLVDEMLEECHQVESTHQLLDNASALYEKSSKCQSELDNVLERLNALKDCVKASDLCDALQGNCKKLELLEKCLELEQQLDVASKVVKIDVDNAQGELNGIGNKIELIRRCAQASALEDKMLDASKVAQCDVQEIEKLLVSLGNLNTRLINATNMLVNARELWKKHKDCEKSCDLLQIELNECVSQFDELRKSLGVCPLCGGKLQ